MSDVNASLVDGKKILVTGGAGFIGCAISERLAARASRYVVMDNLHPQIHANAVRPVALHEKAELVVADVTDAGAWDALLSDFQPEIIIHLAAETGTGQSLTEASRHALVNVVGTTRLTDAIVKHGIAVEHILLTSSRAVYGEGAWQKADGTIVYPGQRGRAQLEAAQWDFPGMTMLPSRADRTEPRPTSVYGATKLAQEHGRASRAPCCRGARVSCSYPAPIEPCPTAGPRPARHCPPARPAPDSANCSRACRSADRRIGSAIRRGSRRPLALHWPHRGRRRSRPPRRMKTPSRQGCRHPLHKLRARMRRPSPRPA